MEEIEERRLKLEADELKNLTQGLLRSAKRQRSLSLKNVNKSIQRIDSQATQKEVERENKSHIMN